MSAGERVTMEEHVRDRVRLILTKRYSERSALQCLAHANGFCPFCSVKIDTENYSFDHVRPLSQGGVDHPVNLLLCCRTCNRMKGSMKLENFVAHCRRVAALAEGREKESNG